MWIDAKIITKMKILNKTQPIDTGTSHMKQQYTAGHDYNYLILQYSLGICHIVRKHMNAMTANIEQS